MNTVITPEDRLSKGPLVALFDRDGTLVQICDDPNSAPMPPAVRKLLLDLADSPEVTVGILSARSCRQLATDVGSQKLILAGNYGMEISFPQSSKFVHPTAQAALGRLAEVKMRLDSQMSQDWRTVLEDHGLTLCWHWSQTPERLRQFVHDTLDGLKLEFPDLLFQALPTSYEVWPGMMWDKGCGLTEIECRLPPSSSPWQFLYAGDSEKDEPAFAWINARHGVSLKVGLTDATQAQIQLSSPKALLDFMSQLLLLRRQAYYE